MSGINDQIKKGASRVFRRAYIKRRTNTTALFESDWQEITLDIKKWGKIKQEIDAVRLNKFKLSNVTLKLSNEDGRYNPETDEASIWYNHFGQQRTLVKIEAGFYETKEVTPGNWMRYEYPGEVLWDQDIWDKGIWDEDGNATIYVGIVSGDIPISDKNEITLKVAPLTQVFKDYAARNIKGYDSSMTASKFMQLVWNHTDGSSGFIFRPFFGDTTTYWDVSSTSTIYSDLNTSGAKDILDKTVWDVMEKFAEVENFALYIDRTGVFKFVSRDGASSVTSFQFGAGYYSGTYGHTIKAIDEYGKKYSKYYSRVQVKFSDSDTITSYVTYEATLTVSTASNPWNYGERTLSIENYWIPNTSTAETLALNVYNEYSAVKNEIIFKTSFIPNVTVLDRCQVSYDSTEVDYNTLFDINDWAYDDTSLSTDLVFDSNKGEAIRLNNEEFKFLSIEIDLDRLETRFLGREA